MATVTIFSDFGYLSSNWRNGLEEVLPLSQHVMKQCIINQSKSVTPGWKSANQNSIFLNRLQEILRRLILRVQWVFSATFQYSLFLPGLGYWKSLPVNLNLRVSHPVWTSGFWKKIGFKKPGIQSSCIFYNLCLLCSGERALCQYAIFTTRGHFDTCFWLQFFRLLNCKHRYLLCLHISSIS